MSDMQQAREVLARVRAAATPRPWSTDVSFEQAGEFISANVVAEMWDVASFTGAYVPPGEGREERAHADRVLFLLTSNPDLLDALDELLAVGQASKGTNPFAAGYVVYVERIAAAIIAADERMTS